MEDISIVRFVLSFAFVLGLIGLFALGLRRWGNRLPIMHGSTGTRLKVLETCHLGPRHRLLLVRRDAQEHLLLLGPDSAEVIEKGIADAPRHKE